MNYKQIQIIFFITLIDIMFSANINIEIKTGEDITKTSVNCTGHHRRVVTNEDIQLFNINDRNLINALQNHYGRKPTSAYIKSPTPWGDLYKVNHWEQVSRILTVSSARLKTVNTKPVVVTSNHFENRSNKTIKINTGVSQSVENTVTTIWSVNGEMTVSQEIEYGLSFAFGTGSGTTGFSYTASWGESDEKTESVTIGSNTGVEVELLPGQAINAVLSANKGTIEVEIVYKCTLRGQVAVNFKKPYNGHHFWSPSIDDVLTSGNIVREKFFTQTITIGFYTDGSLKVFDKNTGLPI